MRIILVVVCLFVCALVNSESQIPDASAKTSCIKRLIAAKLDEKDAQSFCMSSPEEVRINCAEIVINKRPATAFVDDGWSTSGLNSQETANRSSLFFCKHGRHPEQAKEFVRLIDAGHYPMLASRVCDQNCDQSIIDCVINLTRSIDPKSHDSARMLCVKDPMPKVSCIVSQINLRRTKSVLVAHMMCESMKTRGENAQIASETTVGNSDEKRRKKSEEQLQKFNEKIKPFVIESLRDTKATSK